MRCVYFCWALRLRRSSSSAVCCLCTAVPFELVVFMLLVLLLPFMMLQSNIRHFLWWSTLCLLCPAMH